MTFSLFKKDHTGHSKEKYTLTIKTERINFNKGSRIFIQQSMSFVPWYAILFLQKYIVLGV